MLPIDAIAKAGRPLRLTGVPAGLLPWLMAGLARAGGLDGRRAVLVAADEAAGRAVVEAAPFFAPDVTTLWLPAWDCLPYDRASPAQKVLADRLAAMAVLARAPEGAELLVTTVAAVAQRIRDVVAADLTGTGLFREIAPNAAPAPAVIDTATTADVIDSNGPLGTRRFRCRPRL
mgnify:CR=1 FL=1